MDDLKRQQELAMLDVCSMARIISEEPGPPALMSPHLFAMLREKVAVLNAASDAYSISLGLQPRWTR